MPIPGEIRFEAKWINKWNEHEVGYHPTRKAAERAAFTGSRKAGQSDWFTVAEQKYVGGEWVDQRRWTGTAWMQTTV